MKLNETFIICAKTKTSNFSRSNSNLSILTPTFSRDGFYNSYFQNPSVKGMSKRYLYPVLTHLLFLTTSKLLAAAD